MTVHIGVVLDMSGSMSATYAATVEGLKSYIKTQQKETPDALFSLTAFDNRFERWVVSTPISLLSAKAIVERYKPRGSTALYDAIGHTVSSMQERVEKKDKAIVVIMTDGYENASQEYNIDSIKKLIDNLQKKNWTFLYLGANVDAWAESQKLGIFFGNTASFSYGEGQTKAFASLARGSSVYANSDAQSTPTFFADANLKQEFTEEESEVKVGS